MVVFQRRSNCECIQICHKAGCNQTEDWGEIPLWIKRKEDCFLNIFLQNHRAWLTPLLSSNVRTLGGPPGPLETGS